LKTFLKTNDAKLDRKEAKILKTAAIYTRKSKLTEKGESINNQIIACKEYLKRLNIEDYIIYEDEGFSGKNTTRPQFKNMLRDAKNKRFDILICYRLDRVSRNVSDFSTLIEELEKYNISFISVNEQFDTTNPMGRAMMYISSVFGQLERETICERVRFNMTELSKTGRWLGGLTPTGFISKQIKYIDEKSKERTMFELIPIKEELVIVKLIFDKYLELKSLSQVMKYLLTNNIKSKKGNDFTRNTIQAILKNPVYVKSTTEVVDYIESNGITVVGVPDDIHAFLSYNKRKGKSGYRETDEWIYAIGRHEGIISGANWIEIQRILEENSEKAPRLGKTNVALLTGILRCACCGSNMKIIYGSKKKDTEERLHYYACTMKHDSGGTRCKNKNVRADILEGIVVDKLKDYTHNKNMLLKELDNYRKELIGSTVNSSINNLKDELKKIDYTVDNLLSTVSKSDDDDVSEMLISKLKLLSQERKALEKKFKELERERNSIQSQIINIDIICESLKKFSSLYETCSFDEKKLLIASIIDKITWDGITGEVNINLWGAAKKK
jgi:site-specific DNA recombinase